MKAFSLLLMTLLLMVVAESAFAGTITGEYLEARTCDVYTGPCFANAEMSLAGKEAVMAWKIETGAWNDVALIGLGVALVVKSEGTIGHDGVFPIGVETPEQLLLKYQRLQVQAPAPGATVSAPMPGPLLADVPGAA